MEPLDVVAYFNDQLKDGFQLEDVTRTVRFGIRAVVRQAAEKIPGSDGTAKLEWVKVELKRIMHGLIGTARGLYMTGLLAIAGYALELLANQVGDAAIDWLADHVLEPVIEFAYADEVLEGGLQSASFKAAFAG